MLDFKDLLREHGYVSRFNEFQRLMQYRVREILLASSLYDSFIFEQDGRLSEMLLSEYLDLNLSQAPGITRVSTGSEALDHICGLQRYDLIITTMNLADMEAVELARRVRELRPDLPVVALLYDTRELAELTTYHDIAVFEKVFIWQGDFRTLIGIIKYVEDRRNVEHDTETFGVQSIVLIEDNVSAYSSFLPIIYAEIVKHTQQVMVESVNLSHKLMRMRARPKILLCSTYEEAWDLFRRYDTCILGIISDIEFRSGGHLDPEAGLRLAAQVRALHFDIPILLQSDSPHFEDAARQIGAGFLLKRSPRLLQQLREFMADRFSFGDFVFRLPDGQEVGRADSLRSLEEQLSIVPDESVRFHAERNHFSNWLKARTEFLLADRLRPRKVSDFASVRLLREDLVASMREFRQERNSGIVVDFDRKSADALAGLARIGTGSLGGKARGVAFVNSLLKNFKLHDRFEEIRVSVPPAVVLATDIFDQFMDANGLSRLAIESLDEREITHRFRTGSLPDWVIRDLAAFVEMADYPLAVRSSSLLEDSKFQPFAGIYDTFMLPNDHPDPQVRLNELIDAIVRVYASTYSSRSKAYMATTVFRLEEEKMAVLIQRLVGSAHENRFYPSFSGVARSYNFYPHPPMQPQDGVVSVALGLGAAVVEGDLSIRFCPRYPRHLVQLSGIQDTLRYSQKDFLALALGSPAEHRGTDEKNLIRCGLDDAERDGTLAPVASTYSQENDAVFDGLSRPGVRLVTFAPILKNRLFPLPEILNIVLDMGAWGIGTPVEVEFAVNMESQPGGRSEVALLQMRPLVTTREFEELSVSDIGPEEALCISNRVLGHGIIENVLDIVVVDPDAFQREHSVDVAREVSRFNAELAAANSPFLLIGIGRWGSADPWLGIPVSWEQISGARAVVESSFRDFDVTPSEGSHFFQNMISARVGYFTVNAHQSGGHVDWDWLRRQPARGTGQYVRHIKLDSPVIIKMDGRTGRGVIGKPGSRTRAFL
jgi:CheY-like chemotaxis protein